MSLTTRLFTKKKKNIGKTAVHNGYPIGEITAQMLQGGELLFQLDGHGWYGVPDGYIEVDMPYKALEIAKIT